MEDTPEAGADKGLGQLSAFAGSIPASIPNDELVWYMLTDKKRKNESQKHQADQSQ